MIDLFLSIIPLIKLLLAYGFLFVILPMIVIRSDKHTNKMDQFFINLVHSHLFIIIVVHLLVVLKIYETISLYIVIIIASIFIWKLSRKKEPLPFGVHQAIKILDITDNKTTVQKKINEVFFKIIERLQNTVLKNLKAFIHHPIIWIVLLLSLAMMAYTRLKHAVTHFYYASSDPYVHLKWVKSLSANQIYVDGVYPYGFEAIISSIHQIFLLDPYYIVRFLGPISAIIVFLSLLYFLNNLFKNKPVLVAISVLIFVITSWLFSNYVWRQLSSLSMEYAIIFFLPGIYFFIHYLNTFKRIHLILASECLILALLIHPYIAVFLGVAYLITGICYFDRILKYKKIFSLFSIMFLSGIIGLLPLIIGRLLGKEFHQASIDFVTESVGLFSKQLSVDQLYQLYSSNRFILVYFISILLLLGAMLFRLENKRILFVLSFLSIIYFGMYQAENLGLPVIIPGYRIEGIFVMMAVPIIAVTIYGIGIFLKDFRKAAFLRSLGTIIVLFVMVYNTSYALPEGDQFQYEEAVTTYLKIKEDFPHQEWTIISTIEEYPFVIGYGWHTNLWEFVKAISDEEKDSLEFNTNYVFLFVEKVPLGLNRMVNREDAAKPFPELNSAQLDNYYRILDYRVILEAKAYYWAEDYLKKHDEMEVYLETDEMKVYLIRQDGNNPINLLKDRTRG